MKVLYTGVRYEHYDASRRNSFEYNNFYLTLKAMLGVEVIEHPYDIILSSSKKIFNTSLMELVRKEKPDVVFAFMYTDELDKNVLRVIRDELRVPTVGWFADDYWRFWNYSRHWAPYFSYLVTTSPQAMRWYKIAGIENVIKSQWACNVGAYGPRDVTQDIDVSFVGQYKKSRKAIIEKLEAGGVRVLTRGFGWSEGKASQEEMLNIFSRSKINLNLNVRPSRLEPATIGRLVLKKSVNRLVPDFHLIDNIRAYWHFAVPHTHARPFELAGSRAFTISGYSEGIEDYYVPDKEMVFYKDRNDLLEKVSYHLLHDTEREEIARKGYERTLRDHTYEKRLAEIFERVLQKK